MYCLDKEGDLVNVGDWVEKSSGDYIFKGRVVVIFNKLGNPNAVRVVVEGDEGLLLIMTPSQIRRFATDVHYKPQTTCEKCGGYIAP